MAAQRQRVEAVEQDGEPLGPAEHVEERIEPGRLGVLAQEPLAELVPGADPELLIRAVEERLAVVAQPPRRAAAGADDQRAIGRRPGRREVGQPPRQQLALARPGGAEHEQRAVDVRGGALPPARLTRRSRIGLTHRPKLALQSVHRVRSPAMDVFSADWPAICRRIVAAQRRIFDEVVTTEERTHYEGVGEGGDHTLVIDRRCEDEVFVELEKLGAEGASFVAVSEERGEVVFGDGGAARVVIDPIDGSLNARRTIPSHSLSIAVAAGDSMADVRFGFVHDFGADDEFMATLGEGADARRRPGQGRRRQRPARGRRPGVGRARLDDPGAAVAGRATPTACGWSARSRSPPPTSPPAASTPSSACAPAARSTPPPPS